MAEFRKELQFMSHTGQGIVRPLLYIPEDAENIKGTLLIIHGMAEHQFRYSEFAEYLSADNWVVCTFDLPGHGMTIKDDSHLGYFSEKDSNEKVLADVKQIILSILKSFQEKPVFILGHSMGSLIARQYCSDTDLNIDGAIFSGTVAPTPLASLAVWLSKRSIRKNGHFYRDNALDKLMHRGFLHLIPDFETVFDWISKDKEVVRKYIEDPLCGYIFTANGFFTLFTWLKQVSNFKWAQRLPSALPVFLLSGDHDPVGGFGRGVRKVHKWLIDSGHNASLKLYSGGRHEMLNELEKNIVWQDIRQWLNLNI
jgi:alpha-beta hydrolase superfamily lysophospholipase